jgi:DNA-binding response OmpR family regulator
MRQVLVIDDDLGTRESFGWILRRDGYAVLTASCGAEAIQTLTRQRIDIVICDLLLPDMSGIDVLRVVRRQMPEHPFILISGFATTKAVIEALRLHVTDVAEKPILAEDLLATVRHAVETVHIGSHAKTLSCPGVSIEAHAARRWALALVPLIECPHDPRTIVEWSKSIAVSPGALRNWCRTAGVTPSRVLKNAVFAPKFACGRW